MIRQGDALELASELPDNSVDCIVTSPPYYGLRDYKHPAAWGLEPTLTAYLERLTCLFAELHRALKPTGTLWLNLGDCYAPNKSLLGVPWRVAFALQDQGWILRSDIIWAKPNPMPESVTDRPTRGHEYIFLLVKSKNYWYDADAIRTPSEPTVYKMLDGWDTGEGSHGTIHRNGREKGKSAKDKQRGHTRRHAGFNDRWDAMSKEGQSANGANARTVWTISTQGWAKAHFATFPGEIPRRCILAGCPPGGVVLDPFAGSGTTLAVAKQLGRQYLGFELNPDYIAMAEERLSGVTPPLEGLVA